MKLKLKRQPESSGIESFRFLSLLVAGVLAVGCSSEASLTPGQAAQATLEEAPEQSLLHPAAIPFSSKEPVLSMIMLDADVRLGLSLEDAKKLFPRPGRSFPIQELPAGLDGQFDVTGWEQGPLSIGIISAKGRAALFLEIQEKADEASALERVSEVSDRHGLPTATISQGPTRYWFWEAPGERIMICLTSDGGGRMAVSCALGSPTLMSALRMSPIHAQEDAPEAEKILSNQPAAKPEQKPDAEVTDALQQE